MDCVKWLAELDGQIPTIVLEARDDHGGDLADVRVEVDSRPVQNYAAGRPFELDPGRHVLRVESGGQSVEKELVAIEAEKDRRLSVTVPSSRAAFLATPARLPPAIPATLPERRPVPALAYVFGGLGAAALVSFASFDTIGFAEHQHLRTTCGPSCTPSQVTPIRTEYAIGDTSLLVSVASLVTASVLVLTRPRATSAAGARLTVTIEPAGLRFWGAF
jgi:hypothetical protein